MNTSFEKVLDEVIENYKKRVARINESAQQGQATSRSEMNAFMGDNAQAVLVSNIKMHLRKGLVTNPTEMEEFLKRTKATVLRDKREGYQSIIALCDRLILAIKGIRK